MRSQIEELEREAHAAIEASRSSSELEQLRVAYLGRNGKLTQILRSLGQIPAEQRKDVGFEANRAKAPARRTVSAAVRYSRDRPPT